MKWTKLIKAEEKQIPQEIVSFINNEFGKIKQNIPSTINTWNFFKSLKEKTNTNFDDIDSKCTKLINKFSDDLFEIQREIVDRLLNKNNEVH